MLVSCVDENENYKNQNDFLINYKSEFVMEDSDATSGYYTDRSKFIESFTHKHIASDTLVLSTLFKVNACSKIRPNIRVSNDTLYLLVEDVGGNHCSSVEFRKYTYYINTETLNIKNIVW